VIAANADADVAHRQLLADEGFTLLETLISLVIIATVLLSTGVFLVQSFSSTRYQSERQAAVQIATDAMEKLRAMPPSTLLAGRDQANVLSAIHNSWNAAQTAEPTLWNYLRDLERVPGTALPSTGTVTEPAVPLQETVSLRNLSFTRRSYIGRCYAASSGGPCTKRAATSPAKGLPGAPVELLRVVVAVTWRDKECARSECAYYLSTLVEPSATDPLLPPIPADPTPAPTPTSYPDPEPAPGTVPAAIWANRTGPSGNSALSIGVAGVFTINGLVHSNSGIAILTGVGSMTPRVEYTTVFNKSIAALVFGTPTPIKVAAATPQIRRIADYRPGGSRAVAAGAKYRAINCTSGTWTYSDAVVGNATVVYVPCDVSLFGTVKPLIVAEGTITVNSGVIGDSAAPSTTGLVSNSSANPAITINAIFMSLHGNVQAINGGVKIPLLYLSSMNCGIVADTISIDVTEVSGIKVEPNCAW
jgi:prepilin-type N-terminal cleavage/methylation domain-containing protein